MGRKELLIKLEEIFKDVFDDQDIILKEGMTSEDIGNWDSLHALCLFNEIENCFGISLTLNETTKMKDVSTICSIIESHLG